MHFRSQYRRAIASVSLALLEAYSIGGTNGHIRPELVPHFVGRLRGGRVGRGFLEQGIRRCRRLREPVEGWRNGDLQVFLGYFEGRAGRAFGKASQESRHCLAGVGRRSCPSLQVRAVQKGDERLEFTDVQHGSNAEYPDLELSQPASGRKRFRPRPWPRTGIRG